MRNELASGGLRFRFREGTVSDHSGGSTGEMVDARAGLIRVSAALVRRKESTEQDFQRVLGFVFHRQVALLT